MQRAAKKDLTHNAITDIIAELRDKYGQPISFKDTHQIKNFCDFVLTFGGQITNHSRDYGFKSSGKTILVEVKTGNKELTDGEKKYLEKCFGDYALVHNFEELLEVMESSCNHEDYYANGYMHIINEIRKKYYNEMLGKADPQDIKDPRNYK